jgi:hypothetical protein
MSKAAELANLIGNINAGGGGVGRNLIINGAMNVSQRGTSFADVSNDTYTLDRFNRRESNDGAVTITQDSSAPSGFANSLKVDVTTADSSIGSSQFEAIEHIIEAQNLQTLAFGTSDAKNFTVSFYVKSNKTGTYALNVIQEDNSSKQATLNYTIDSADTWERKSLTFTGDTSGVINDDNGNGFKILIWLAAGSDFTSGSATATFQSYSNAQAAAQHGVNLLDSTSNEWFITGLQLEVGQNATSFEHEPFERTLAKCQRYYQRWQANTAYDGVCTGAMYSDTFWLGDYRLSPEMRAEPTFSANGTFKVNASGGDMNASNLGLNRATPQTIQIECDTTDSDRIGQAGLLRAGADSDAYCEFISEL